MAFNLFVVGSHLGFPFMLCLSHENALGESVHRLREYLAFLQHPVRLKKIKNKAQITDTNRKVKIEKKSAFTFIVKSVGSMAKNVEYFSLLFGLGQISPLLGCTQAPALRGLGLKSSPSAKADCRNARIRIRFFLIIDNSIGDLSFG